MGLRVYKTNIRKTSFQKANAFSCYAAPLLLTIDEARAGSFLFVAHVLFWLPNFPGMVFS